MIEMTLAAHRLPPLTRPGAIIVNDRAVGYVDRYHPARGMTVHTWRYVRDGGSTDGRRYPTRREAVVALIAAP